MYMVKAEIQMDLFQSLHNTSTQMENTPLTDLRNVNESRQSTSVPTYARESYIIMNIVKRLYKHIPLKYMTINTSLGSKNQHQQLHPGKYPKPDHNASGQSCDHVVTRRWPEVSPV